MKFKLVDTENICGVVPIYVCPRPWSLGMSHNNRTHTDQYILVVDKKVLIKKGNELDRTRSRKKVV